LRDYGTGWDGGDPTCDHRPPTDFVSVASSGLHRPSAGGNIGHRYDRVYKTHCPCGAVRTDQQIGMEADIDEYVAQLVRVFDEVKRVLRNDGTVWLVLGDRYAGGGGYYPHAPSNRTSKSSRNASVQQHGRVPQGLKRKDLIGLPWRVAFALQAAGWYLRSAVIWEKPSVMPESVRDRPTSCYETIFLLSKSERYYYDADAIAEPVQQNTPQRYQYGFPGDVDAQKNRTRSLRNAGTLCAATTRNSRNIWRIVQQAVPGHHATFPIKLAERCILAGSRPNDTILDPFGGTGTTAVAAVKHGRHAVLIELNPAYVEIARGRLAVPRDEGMGVTSTGGTAYLMMDEIKLS
jgi:DNA modification methylase